MAKKARKVPIRLTPEEVVLLRAKLIKYPSPVGSPELTLEEGLLSYLPDYVQDENGELWYAPI